MAGKKLSNRQKMINMMYLVLLALVALNVSAEVLDAFENLRVRLQKTAAVANLHEEEYVNQMKRIIDEEIKNLNKMDNAGLKDTLDLIRNRSRELTGLIDRHLQVMELLANKDTASGTFLDKDETEKNFQYWMGDNEEANRGRGNGHAYSLRNELDAYSHFIAELYNLQLKDAKHAIEPEVIRDPGKGRKSWERYTFEGPVIGNLAILESLKIDLYRQEEKLFELLQTRLGRHKYVADTVIAVNSPVSTVVTAGLPFQTRLNVALSSSTFNPVYHSVNGRITLENGGNTALLNIAASGSVIPDGKSEGVQSYTASIEVPTAFGDKKMITVRDQFVVRRPEILIQSEAIQVLYRRCGNNVTIDVPALGEYYNPVVNTSTGIIRQHAIAQKQFLIMPEGDNCMVNVSSHTNGQTIKIGSVGYRVIEPPKPAIQLMVNQREFTGTQTIDPGSVLSLRLLPDKEFERKMSRDAKYQIAKVEVYLKDRIGPPRRVATLSMAGKNANRFQRIRLGAEVDQAKSGTPFYLKITKIYRKNFKGELIEDPRFGERERTLAFIRK